MWSQNIPVPYGLRDSHVTQKTTTFKWNKIYIVFFSFSFFSHRVLFWQTPYIALVIGDHPQTTLQTNI